MAAYSYPLTQTVAVNENILFLNDRACKKGFILHNDASGIFRIKGASNCCKSIYKVHFNANVAVSAAADGGVLEPISVALVQNGEVIRSAIAVVTPAAIGDFWNIGFEYLVELPCDCCDQITVKNISEQTSIDVVNAYIIIDRVA